jgi:hypothetical protein
MVTTSTINAALLKVATVAKYLKHANISSLATIDEFSTRPKIMLYMQFG